MASCNSQLDMRGTVVSHSTCFVGVFFWRAVPSVGSIKIKNIYKREIKMIAWPQNVRDDYLNQAGCKTVSLRILADSSWRIWWPWHTQQVVVTPRGKLAKNVIFCEHIRFCARQHRPSESDMHIVHVAGVTSSNASKEKLSQASWNYPERKRSQGSDPRCLLGCFLCTFSTCMAHQSN